MRRLSVVCLVAASLFGATLETRRATSATQDAATRSIHLKGLKDLVTLHLRAIVRLRTHPNKNSRDANVRSLATYLVPPQGFEPRTNRL